MNLGKLFSPKIQKPTPEYFLAVEIHESMIKTALWQIENETPSIVNIGSYEMWDSQESLVNGVDASLTSAVSTIKGEPDRVIFGLPDSWLVGDKIHESKQALIKNLINALKLKPIGLVTISQAIVTELKAQEGVPPTAILLEIYPSKVIVSLIVTGIIQAIEEVGRSDDLARDVEEGLARFEAEKLPARFILTNGSDLVSEEQQIISYPWSDKLSFVHLPKVNALPIDFSIRAIALAGGSEAAKSLGVEVVSPNDQLSISTSTTKPLTATPSENLDSDLESVGFAPLTQSQPDQDSPVEDEPKSTVVIHDQNPDTDSSPFTEPDSETPSPNPKRSLHLPKFHIPRPHLGKLTLLLIPVIPLFLVLIICLGYFFLATATVKVSLVPKHLNQNYSVFIGDKRPDNQDSLFISATPQTLSGKTSKTVATTGEATVGDKATGKITIYNKLLTSVTLKSGTRITSPNGLVFTIDTSVNIASSSSQTDPATQVVTITPGNTSAQVTALKYGAEYNLDKGTQYTVDNYPTTSLIATSDQDFIGGSSRTVKAVSKDDQEKLLQSASQVISSDISDQLQKSSPDNRFISIANLKYLTKNFDHTVGEEANSLSLDLAGELSTLVYSQSDINKLVSQKLVSQNGSNLQLDQEKTQIVVSDPVAVTSNLYSSKVSVDAFLVPVVEKSGYINLIKGRPIKDIKALLQTIEGYQSTSISITPPIPILDQFLPYNSQKIQLDFVTSP